MGLLRHWISGGVWTIFALVLWGSPIRAAEMPGERVVEPASSLARAYRKLGDLYTTAALRGKRLGMSRSFWTLLAEPRRSPSSFLSSILRGFLAIPIKPLPMVHGQSRHTKSPENSAIRRRLSGSVIFTARVPSYPRTYGPLLPFSAWPVTAGYAGARWRLAEMMLRGEGLPGRPEGSACRA
ncbi:hypothetical protein LP421_31960 (plasmid) [Rhizobium sp. RCAM05350]|nr:hypothetical protein LP421_31960 [Rhizobium sp. RCAM05350]